MISLIVVTFNQIRLLINTLEGICVQLSMNPQLDVEVLIVDNGSQPPTEDLIPPRTRSTLPIQFVSRPLAKAPFRAASARNLGIERARGNFILFLDGDCIPGPSHLFSHWKELSTAKIPIVTIGHRIFVDGDVVSPSMIRLRECDLRDLPEVPSESNYQLKTDRRLEELNKLAEHPMPFNCLHGCNVGIGTDLIRLNGFDVEFDGYWGYEDIELGYRLWKKGVEFRYLPDAFVYHQEGLGMSAAQRLLDRKRNFRLACDKIPGFEQFRNRLAKGYYDDR